LPRFGNCIRSVRQYCQCLHSTLYSKVSHLDLLREPHFMSQLRQEPHINKIKYLFFFNGFFLLLIQIKQLIFIPLSVFCLQKVFQNAVHVSLVAIYTIYILFCMQIAQAVPGTYASRMRLANSFVVPSLYEMFSNHKISLYFVNTRTLQYRVFHSWIGKVV